MSEKNRPLEVSELTEYIKLLIGSDEFLGSVTVRGELSNYKVYPSGHHYFTMKDATSSVRCVMFKSAAQKLRFTPESGMKMIAFGRIEVYLRDGAYQFYVTDMTPDGVGDLYVEFERLKEKLRLEGLFDEARKRPLPRFPRTIAVVTSSAGAAVRDIIRILGARWSAAKVVVLPVRVQGEEAPREIVSALRYCNRHNVADVIITGRGGGSIEDLWAFNDERVARAIFESEIPVISAVGHEPDVTIADFVADVRASTPSNAAEIAVPDINEVRDWLNGAQNQLQRAVARDIDTRRRKLDAVSDKRVMRSPETYFADRRIALDRRAERLRDMVQRRVQSSRASLGSTAAALDALSPLKVLGRGYAVARKADGGVIRTAADTGIGERITVKLLKNELDCTVEEIR